MRIWVLLTLLVVCGGRSEAASRDVQYGPAPAWTTAPPGSPAAAPLESGPARIVYGDWQIHLGDNGDDIYSAYRLKILTPQGLAAGNITATWNPSSDDLIVHKLNIIRDGQVVDVLAATKFKVIERENNLDYAVLDGQLTATLQAPGLQVGDELEFAATIHRRDPTFGDRSYGLVQFPLGATPGVFRTRLSWPGARKLQWRATPDVGPAAADQKGDQRALTYELRAPASAILADGAPARVNVRRLIEYSGFSSWSEVANVLAPLFDDAAKLGPDSPVRLEAAKIAKTTNDPGERAEAALRLVQDRIRYVYVGLDGGNYRPAKADDTWSRRFGDCKAKTALLIALLRELGVQAQAVLVNSKGGDGTDQRLPTPQMFDHVLVRATIGSKSHWLDGTRMGDRRLANLPPPAFRWALPLETGAVTLEAVAAEPPRLPQWLEAVSVDASAGFEVPAKIEISRTLRGDAALELQQALSNLAPDDTQRGLMALWRQQADWVDADTATWRYDEAGNLLVLDMTGTEKPDWKVDDGGGRSLDIYGAGFTPPDKLSRPKEQDQTAPWLTDLPLYKCWATTIKLPPATAKWRWSFEAAPVEARLGGVAYFRIAELRDGVMYTVMSKNAYLPEITASQAKALDEALPSFDNNISRVFEIAAPRMPIGAKAKSAPEKHAPGPGAVDWSDPTALCAVSDGVATKGGVLKVPQKP